MTQQKNDADRILTIPNGLTLVRFLLIGVMVAYFAKDEPITAMFLYLAAAATDVVDGYVARHFHQISNVGKVLDPIADKAMTVAALVCMLVKGYLSTALVIVIVAKEALMIAGGALAYFAFHKVVFANKFGKFAAGAYFCAIVLLFMHRMVAPYDAYFMYVVVAINLLSMLQYGYLNIFLEYKNRKRLAR